LDHSYVYCAGKLLMNSFAGISMETLCLEEFQPTLGEGLSMELVSSKSSL